MFDPGNNVARVVLSLGKMWAVDVLVWSRSAVLGSCRPPAAVPRLLASVTRSAPEGVVLGEAFRGLAAALMGASPITRKCVAGGFAWPKSRGGRV